MWNLISNLKEKVLFSLKWQSDLVTKKKKKCSNAKHQNLWVVHESDLFYFYLIYVPPGNLTEYGMRYGGTVPTTAVQVWSHHSPSPQEFTESVKWWLYKLSRPSTVVYKCSLRNSSSFRKHRSDTRWSEVGRLVAQKINTETIKLFRNTVSMSLLSWGLGTCLFKCVYWKSKEKHSH